jgi:hypothetical protein
VLSTGISAGFADPQFKARIKDIGGETRLAPAAEFGKFIAGETSKWAKVIKFAGVKAD